VGERGGDATYSWAFSRWVIEDATEVQMLYQPEITIICISLIQNISSKISK